MHYYVFNIGDYISHTKHLTIIEDCAYRRLLDIYYLHERPIINDITKVSRAINMSGYENEVNIVLEEFFELKENHWVNSRCDEEIERYKNKIETASVAGKASAAARMNRRSTDAHLTLNRRSTDVQPTNNQEPRTILLKENNINIKKENDFDALSFLKNLGVDDQVAHDFCKLRKSKKSDLTKTAITRIQNEAEKHGFFLNEALAICCERGWLGFRAEWLADKKNIAYTNSSSTKAAALAIFGDIEND